MGVRRSGSFLLATANPYSGSAVTCCFTQVLLIQKGNIRASVRTLLLRMLRTCGDKAVKSFDFREGSISVTWGVWFGSALLSKAHVV